MTAAIDNDEMAKIALLLPRVVIKVSAEWCGPCKAIQPQYNLLADSEQHKNYVFYHLDLDRAPNFCEKYNIVSLPTFIVFHEGSENARVVGAKIEDLKAALLNSSNEANSTSAV